MNDLNIHFCDDPGAELRQILEGTPYTKCCVVVDDHTVLHCYPLVRSALPEHALVTVPSGEEHKNLDTCQTLWQAFTDQALDRHSVVIVLGGGVLCDMGGFCAATYKRGIDFILVPTTLLAQVDASIGGKLGVDFNHLKNHIGLFRLPASTIIHDGFLKTLPEEELRSGFAEVIKHTLIADDGMWDEVRSMSFPSLNWQRLIRHSVDVKGKIVADDPQEQGLRKLLNAGHTIGHAIETHLLRQGRKVTHGEAIAAGLICESYLSTERGLLPKNHADQISAFILETFGKLTLEEKDDDPIAGLTVQDKKNSGNRILCVLLERPGKARWDCEISLEDVKGALSSYRATQT